MRKRIGALSNRWHRRMPMFRLPLVAPSFDRPIFVDRLCGDAVRARTGGRNIVRGLATRFGGRFNDDDPRSDCIQLFVRRRLELRLRSGAESNRPACRLGRLGRRLLSRHRYAR
jgi:hypothetical protein